MKLLDYEFEPMDIFINSAQAELAISTAMLTSLLSRKLITLQQYNECVTKLKQLYSAQKKDFSL